MSKSILFTLSKWKLDLLKQRFHFFSWHSLQMMDLLVMIAAKNKIIPTGHVIISSGTDRTDISQVSYVTFDPCAGFHFWAGICDCPQTESSGIVLQFSVCVCLSLSLENWNMVWKDTHFPKNLYFDQIHAVDTFFKPSKLYLHWLHTVSHSDTPVWKSLTFVKRHYVNQLGKEYSPGRGICAL